jgi:ComF family protein
VTLVRSVTNALLSALLSPPCAACGRVLDQPLSGAVCAPCWDSVVAVSSAFSIEVIRAARAIGWYEGALRDVLHALKYEGRRSVAPRLARMMAAHGADVLRDADFVVPVPLHRRRQRERGFNQAEDLARGLGLPLLHALTRARATPPQVGLAAAERQRNVENAFALRAGGRLLNLPKWPPRWDGGPTCRLGRSEDRPLQGRVIVLVDDVATTGATLEACARVLKNGGAADVRALTAARVASARR